MQAQSRATGGFSRNKRRFLEWFAVLALVAYALQITALDHWHNDPIPASEEATHSSHCHGVLGGCSDSGELPGMLRPTGLTSLPPVFVLNDAPQRLSHPLDAFLDAPEQPPQTA